jgi:hypothetical protein
MRVYWVKRGDSKFFSISYRDKDGRRKRESTFTEDWQEAHKMLRARLQARDDNDLDVIRKGESLTFGEWADFFLEKYSKPPFRKPGTHNANLRCVGIPDDADQCSEHADHRFRVDGDHDSGMMPITRSGMMPIS